MRKTVVIFAILLLSISNSFASPIGLQKARKLAGDFFGTDISAPRLAAGGRTAVSLSGLSEPAYYIFNKDGGGFVIISGDDALDPVLGYSETGHIDTDRIPENMLFWLEQLRKDVMKLRKLGVTASIRESVKRQLPQTRADGAGGVFLDVPTWSQENPYNWFCPTISPYESEKSLTGCVATAISMVMRYHQWPPCGTGSLPSYDMDYYPSNSSKSIKVPMSGHELGHEYKWSIMPTGDIYSETVKYPGEGERQIAWLMYDCGIMVHASYSYEGTAAYSTAIAGNLINHMYYKSGAKYVMKSNYSTDEWMSLIKGQLDAGLPVIYGADSESGGHQFVVNGYDADDNLYVNWGWGGDFNGYFELDYFYPYKDVDWTKQGYTEEEARQIEEEETFSSNHDAIINVEPDRSTTPVPVAMDEPVPIVTEIEAQPTGLYLKAGWVSTHQYFGLSVSSGDFSRGGSFKMNAGLIHNPTSSRYDGYFRFVQTDYKGEVIGPVSLNDKEAYVKAGNSYQIYDIDCKAQYDWNLGDKIQFFSRTRQSDKYTLVDWIKDDGTIGEIPLVPMYFISPLKSETLINSNEVYDSVNWSSGEGYEKAVITYPDGSVETIVKPT